MERNINQCCYGDIISDQWYPIIAVMDQRTDNVNNNSCIIIVDTIQQLHVQCQHHQHVWYIIASRDTHRKEITICVANLDSEWTIKHVSQYDCNVGTIISVPIMFTIGIGYIMEVYMVISHCGFINRQRYKWYSTTIIIVHHHNRTQLGVAIVDLKRWI